MLVTGPAGFVGGHLRAELGDAFVPFDGDVLDADALRARPSARRSPRRWSTSRRDSSVAALVGGPGRAPGA